MATPAEQLPAALNSTFARSWHCRAAHADEFGDEPSPLAAGAWRDRGQGLAVNS